MINFEALLDAPEEEVANLCAIDLNHLETALQNHASLYAYAEAVYETAQYKESVAAAKVDELEASIFQEIQDQEPGLAIGKTERRVECDDRVLDAKKDLRERQRLCGILKALIRGLQHRKDMLIQISSRQKAEARQY